MTINRKSELVSLNCPRVMGTLDHTPDSLSEGSRVTEKTLLNRTGEMFIQGADFIGVGGYSIRSNAAEVPEEEELARVIPVVCQLTKVFPDMLISVDTFRNKVARQAVAEDAAIIDNMSTGGLGSRILRVVAEAQVPYVTMYMRGTPQTVRRHIDHNHTIVDMFYYFSERKTAMVEMGINDVIIDVGFGFSRTLNQNCEILERLERSQILGALLLVGLSRKPMLYKLLNTDSAGALNAAIIANTVALLKGAHIIRVHDVKEVKKCVKIINKIR